MIYKKFRIFNLFFLAAGKLSEIRDTLKALLPSYNYEVLRMFIEFLHEVSKEGRRR
jgi:hypothetical protein